MRRQRWPGTGQVNYADRGKPVDARYHDGDGSRGQNVIDLPIEIRKPKLWYPAGYGEQPRYEFTAQVGSRQSGSVDTQASKSGLRSIVLRSPSGQMGTLV